MLYSNRDDQNKNPFEIYFFLPCNHKFEQYDIDEMTYEVIG